MRISDYDYEEIEELDGVGDELESMGVVPSEPIYGSVDRGEKLASLMLDLNDDLQDEIGERRAQFEAVVNMVDAVSNVTMNKFEVVYRAIAICYAIGGVALCLILGVMILNM